MSELTRMLSDTLGVPLDRDMNAMLLEMARWGHPRIYSDKDGWHCVVEVFVNQTGVTFKVASEFNMMTPQIATWQCHERLTASLKNLGAIK